MQIFLRIFLAFRLCTHVHLAQTAESFTFAARIVLHRYSPLLIAKDRRGIIEQKTIGSALAGDTIPAASRSTCSWSISASHDIATERNDGRRSESAAFAKTRPPQSRDRWSRCTRGSRCQIHASAYTATTGRGFVKAPVLLLDNDRSLS